MRPEKLEPHSYARPGQPLMTHVAWRAAVDFDAKVIRCQATLYFQRSADDQSVVSLDTRDLGIESITDSSGQPIAYELGARDPVLGQELQFVLPRDSIVIIRYATSPTASGLQWLGPEQTADGTHPFVFSQAECLHARSFLPCQDSPGVRFTFEAALTVPRGLKGLVAAPHQGTDDMGDFQVERYAMEHPVPAYLFAFAIGKLDCQDVGARSCVWAEPSVLPAAAWEFGELNQFLVAGERLFGAYPWERFDILIMPPSFPYGGMENPTLKFLNPSLIAGDRSMANVVAHELAHAWTGNLVTNRGWNDFWLNEGWTTWAELRIIEEHSGVATAALLAALLGQELAHDLAEFRDRPALTHLRTTFGGDTDPDEVFSRVPYLKGMMFLRIIEEHVGRGRFDEFVRRYINRFAFQSIDTDEFQAFVEAEFPGALAAVRADEWINGPGIPGNAPVFASPLMSAIDSLVAAGDLPPDAELDAWDTNAASYYLGKIPRDAVALAAGLAPRFANTQNAELRTAWYLLAIPAGFPVNREELEAFLGKFGRLKFVKPLYLALLASPAYALWAQGAFDRLKGRYHPVAQSVIGGLIAKAAA